MNSSISSALLAQLSSSPIHVNEWQSLRSCDERPATRSSKARASLSVRTAISRLRCWRRRARRRRCRGNGGNADAGAGAPGLQLALHPHEAAVHADELHEEEHVADDAAAGADGADDQR